MRKNIAILLLLALCVSLPGCGGELPKDTVVPEQTEETGPEAAAAESQTEDVVILYTNDVHTYIENPLSYDVIAGLKTALTEKYGNVLLVEATNSPLKAKFPGMLLDYANVEGSGRIVME